MGIAHFLLKKNKIIDIYYTNKFDRKIERENPINFHGDQKSTVNYILKLVRENDFEKLDKIHLNQKYADNHGGSIYLIITNKMGVIKYTQKSKKFTIPSSIIVN